MKKKIAILGSTGSIGRSTLDVIRKDKKSFNVVFLSANNNYKKLIQQAKEFDVKNVVINNKNFYKKVKDSLKKRKTTPTRWAWCSKTNNLDTASKQCFKNSRSLDTFWVPLGPS